MSATDWPEEWAIYEQLNATANSAYAIEVANHGDHVMAHRCEKPQCVAPNARYRRMQRAERVRTARYTEEQAA